MSKKYTHLKIRLASPEEILSWSYGEVTKHETINYRTLKPEKGGLFAEEIFGPVKDFQCACGNKSKKNMIPDTKKCKNCGVEYTEAKVRRERMGHITLAAPVVHAWFLRNTPSRLAILLGLPSKQLEEVVYLASYIVVEPGSTSLEFKQILSEREYSEAYATYGPTFKALSGAEAIKYLLKYKTDLDELEAKLRKELKTASKQKRNQVVKRLAVVEAFKNSDNKPEWMVLDVLPVIPPDLRPMVQLDGGRFATTDLNDLYRRILNRNTRLKKQFNENAPHLITKNEKRMLQEAVDALIDNSKRGRKVVVEKNRPLKSLSDMLRGKQGRFRQNLLGKRVDYSGRSVIAVGPSLEMYQCGLPREMAIILFKPFVIRELMRTNISSNERNAKKLIDQLDDRIWGPLESVVREHPVLLNRAPTLHRLGIQAFEPVLVEGKAIRLHPLVCTAFNADFDGDQMAVHVPLSEEAQAEARVLMLASNNILNPKDGKPVVTPSQDMVLGNYYLTMEEPNEDGQGKVFKDIEEAQLAFESKIITLHTIIAIKASSLGDKIPSDHKNDYLITTLGKLIFNTILPNDFPYLNEGERKPKPGTKKAEDSTNLSNGTPDYYFAKPGTDILAFINNLLDENVCPVVPFRKGFLGKIIAKVFERYQINETSKMLDKLKNQGFYYSTISGITVSAFDVESYPKKREIIAQAEAQVEAIQRDYEDGLLTDSERYNLITSDRDGVWPEARKAIEEGLMSTLNKKNHIYIMQHSGARGNVSNFSQLAGMRGLMKDTKGESIELPVKSCFKEGLTMSEFFISTHGSRKGSTDTALKTAESGYLTRRLVDVSQEVVVTQEDCGTDKGVYVEAFLDRDGKPIETLKARIEGRFTSKEVVDPKTGEVIIGKNEFITPSIASKIVEAGIEGVHIRTVTTCNAHSGVCVHCYGKNLATNSIVEIGEAVGVIAAQSIGEPGTQLTMRTFHTGGVAGGDITNGLPRVQELLEARKPKGKATISEIDGVVTEKKNADDKCTIVITNEQKGETKTYSTIVETTIVEEGDVIKAGQQLTEGSVDPKELLKVSDIETVEQYIIKEVQKVYHTQEVDISDKHLEIIVRQMTRKLYIMLEGDTNLLPGSLVSYNKFVEANKETLLKGLKPAVAVPQILGITRAALRSDSFLSAASFQETTRVLTDAAIKGSVDELIGLKENVIIGGLIPAGTGILNDTHFDYERPSEDELEEDLEYSDFD